MEVGPRAAIAGWLRAQSRWCDRLGSPLYAGLLDRAGDDADAGGPVFELLRGHMADPPGSALALRFMGAVHRLVLSGAAPALAAFYPSVAGSPAPGDPWPAFRATVAEHAEELRSLVERPVQTNEVGRSASLLGGFLAVARETCLPLRVLEVGASAGLNLRWDRYRYESGDWSWGDESSPVRFASVFDGTPPRTNPAVVVAREGCDVNPVDPSTKEGRLTLMAYTWPDQTHRFSQLQGATRVAVDVPASVDCANGPSWVAERLAKPNAGAATLVFHSMVMQYLGKERRARLRATIEEAGGRAKAHAPVAWLRLEPSRLDGGGLVHLTMWPGGEERLLAESSPHGPPVRWLA